jgi:3-oxoacyl-[acyl-carrier protein] reductase
VLIEFLNKTIVVVGGSRGIGLSIVRAFLETGGIVHVISRYQNYDVEVELKSRYSDRVFFYYADATDKDDIRICSERILKNSLGVDVLISNVGNGKSGDAPINPAVEWDESWKVNFDSVLNSSRSFLDLINDGGVILFISSIAGLENIGAPTEYSIAKSAIKTFAKILSHKLAPTIRVNTIFPGNIYFKGGVWDEKLQSEPHLVNEMIKKRVPLEKFGVPQDVANAVLYLASDQASFITGASLTVDGGQTVSF